MNVLSTINSKNTLRLYAWFLERRENVQTVSYEQLGEETGIIRPQSITESLDELAEIGVFTTAKVGKDIQITSSLAFPAKYTEKDSLSDRCAAIDKMSSSGKEYDLTSPFTMKRQSQIAILIEIFGVYFPDKPALQPGAAKDLLRNQPRTEEILLVVESLMGRDIEIRSPYSYVLATIQKRNAEGQTYVKRQSPYNAFEQAIYDMLPDDLVMEDPFAKYLGGD